MSRQGRPSRNTVLRSSVTAVLAAVGATAVMAQAAVCPEQPNPPVPPMDPKLRQTVVITDPDVIRRGNFSLSHTLDAIIQSSPGRPAAAPTQAERIALLSSLLKTFDLTAMTNPDSGLSTPVDQRAGERDLSPAKLLDPTDNTDGMHPVGLFNRLDLAPDNFSYCGEHRIVYAKGKPVSQTNRFFLIFEAGLKNPVEDADLGKRKASCARVAQFWDGLKDKTGADLSSALEQFYYGGLDADKDGGTDFRPVVHMEHYGSPFGQVRGNLFVNNPPSPPFIWQLREWRTIPTASGVDFTPVTVKTNPIPDLYGPKQGSDPLGALKDAFQAAFVDSNEENAKALPTLQEQLLDFDQKLADGTTKAPRTALSASLGMRVNKRFDAFQSNSSSKDDPALIAAGGNLPARIAAKLTGGAAAACKVTETHILNRAGAMSCGGCHQFSAGKEIAPGVVWPAPRVRFVQIDETGGLSPALENEFLPERRRLLEAALVPPPVPDRPVEPVPAYVAVRGALRALGNRAATRLDVLNALTTLETHVEEARRDNEVRPGAFVTMRRAH